MNRNLFLVDDYYLGDDDGEYNFDNYIPKTNDPGPWIFIGASCYSLLCLLVLPLLVICGNRREKRRVNREGWKKAQMEGLDDDSGSETKEEIDHIGAIETEMVEKEGKNKTKIRTVSQRKVAENEERTKMQYNNLIAAQSAIGGHTSAISAHSSAISTRSKRNRGLGRMNYANLYTRASESEEIHEYVSGTGSLDDINYFQNKVIDDVRPEDAADANDPGKEPSYHHEQKEEEFTICCGPNSMCARRNLRYYYGVLADIAHIDRETKRLIQLCWPMTLSACLDALFDAISTAIVAHYLGTSTLTAYIVTDLLIGLTDTFLAGPSDALNTVCAHAIGAENYVLAGQYVQIAAVLYLCLGIPALGIWYVWIGNVVTLMGLDHVADMVSEYTKIAVWHYVLSGLFDGYNALLDICGYVTIGSIIDILFGLTNVIVLWVLCEYWEGFNLYWLGVAELAVSVSYFIFFTILVTCKGWLSPFTKGMLGTFALKNSTAVRNVISTAIPLSFGSLLEYGEWEALTFFVAYLGRAEVAAWGLLESLWGFFESATEGLSEAASIRVAYHLGNGKMNLAKMSSFKSLFIGVSLAFFMTALLFIVGEDLPKWLTPDELLQDMLNELMPMIGVANVFMIFGMVAWTIVGAQGRYKIATIVSVSMTLFVTLPLSAVATFYFTLDLQGIVGAIICGYSTTGLWLGYILLRSDWEHISQTIQEYNAEHSTSDSESSSESSSDSSDSDSDSDSDSE